MYPLLPRARATILTAMLAGAGLLLAACGSDAASTASAPATSTSGPTIETAAGTTPATAPATDASTTTSVVIPHQPPHGPIDAGTWAIRPFLVPFVITTSDQWIRGLNEPQVLGLGRGTKVSFLVTAGVFPGTSAAEVLGTLCPTGTLALATPAETTLLGSSADQVDAVGIAPCTVALGNDQRTIDVGDTVRAVVTTIDDVRIVVLAGGPTADWGVLGPEIEALTASMQRFET